MRRLSTNRSALVRYGLALLTVPVALAARRALYRIVGGSQKRDALRDAEEKFRAIAEICSGAIIIHDGKQPLYLNRASEKLLGYTREELLAKDICQIVHPDYRELIRERSAARCRAKNIGSTAAPD